MNEQEQSIQLHQTEEWVDAIYSCLKAICTALDSDAPPTKETAETIRMLTESAIRLTYPYIG